jgi:two-component system sensor histidine kinase BaeS
MPSQHWEWKGEKPDWGRFSEKRADSSPEQWRGIRRFFGFVFFAVFLTMVAAVGLVIWLLFQVASTASVRIVAFPSLLIIGAVLVLRSVFRTWRPVRGLVGMTGSLADGDYTVRASEPRSGSMRPVVRSFNQMADRLEDADEQRRRLLADLGHEIRTPLTVVRGEIEAMIDGVHDPDPDHLEGLLDEVRVMERLVEDLRTLSLAEAGELSMHPEPTDLSALVGDVVDSHRSAADRSGVVTHISCDEALGEVDVDPVRIREVVANLIVNSLRAMPDGGALSVRVRGTSHDLAEIVVEDTGVGIPAADVEHVFDRFHKGDSSEGSGLGLTISRDLVEAHGGSIAMSSDTGSGTTVTVTLPREHG